MTSPTSDGATTRALGPLRSIRARITLIATGLVAATLIVASLLLMQWVQADLLTSARSSLDQALNEQAGQFGLDVDGPEEIFGFPLEPSDIDGFETVEGFVDGSEVFIGVATAQGNGVAFGEMFIDEIPVAGLVIDVESGEIVEVLDIGFVEPLPDDQLVEQIEALAFDVLEVADDDQQQFLVGAASLDEVEESIDAIRRALYVMVPALILTFAVLIWWLLGRALRPVMSITEQVEAISTTSLDRRVPVPATDDEVSELATVMNRMLDRLQRGGERQRQFSADASHELRSPLSTVRAAAEMLTTNPPEERATRLANDIVSESDRMDELIGDLLELSRLDDDRRAAPHEAVDLVELVSSELAAEIEAGTVTANLPTSVELLASPRQLRRVIRNLTDNACRHADTQVVVSLDVDGGTIDLAFDDDGAGVADDAKQLIFERFSRLDEARTRDVGGSGLGLALVKAIVANHDGAVRAEDSDLGGARFVVTLPAEPQDVQHH